jgi:iron complex outermembrane receptor protein
MRLSKGLLSAAAGTVAAGSLVTGVAVGAETSASSGDLQEIVVTAEKVAEDVTKTPVAISVFSGEQLESQGVVDINQLQNVAPNVNIGTVGRGPYINIRGVYSSDITSKGEQAVSFNTDGIAIGIPQIMSLAFLDIDHVEVLRGPQGTLYGKSSTGGAINVISAKPEDKFDASASITYGNYDTRRTEAMVNVPVTDSFALRLAASSNNRDGYVKPVLHDAAENGSNAKGASLGDENNINARLSALWKFSDNGSLLLQAMGGEISGTGEQSASVLYNRYSTMSTSDALKVYYNPYDNLGLDDHYGSIHGELNVDLGAARLTYNGGYLRFTTADSAGPSVCDPLAAGCGNTYNYSNYVSTNTIDTQELRISNVNPQRLEYVAGVNYINQTSNEHDVNWQNQAFAGVNVTPNYGTGYANCPAAPNSLYWCNVPNPNIIGPTSHTAKGVFGQVNFHLTDTWKLIAGLRYSTDSMYRHSTIAVGPPNPPVGHTVGGLNYYTDINQNPCYPGDPCVPTSAPGVPALNDYASESASKVTWRAGIEDQFTETQMWYATVATGYKAGSFNDFCPGSTGGCAYGPEDMISYELGYKGKILPNLEIDTDVYYYDYSKFQYTQPEFVFGSPPNIGIIIYTTTVPLTMYGWEGELHWNVTPDDLFNVTATVANGYYGAHTLVGLNAPFTGPQKDAVGKRVDMLPPFSFTASYEHRFPLSDGAYVSASLSSKISSGYFLSGFGGDPTSPNRPYQKPYTLTNFDLAYNSESGKWRIGAFIRNIENKMQMLGGVGNNGSLNVSAPMTTGVRVSMHY